MVIVWLVILSAVAASEPEAGTRPDPSRASGADPTAVLDRFYALVGEGRVDAAMGLFRAHQPEQVLAARAFVERRSSPVANHPVEHVLLRTLRLDGVALCVSELGSPAEPARSKVERVALVRDGDEWLLLPDPFDPTSEINALGSGENSRFLSLLRDYSVSEHRARALREFGGESTPMSLAWSPEARAVLYLHGRIIQVEQDPRPRHERYGVYELEEILQALRRPGFLVRGDIRPRSMSVDEAADQVVMRVRRLLDAGVSVDHVAVVGGSMGAAIALVAAARLADPKLRYAVLGTCFSASAARIAEREGKPPIGHILAIREAGDEITSPCSPLRQEPPSEESPGVREIVLHTGSAHGFLYRPIPAWVDPVVQWVRRGY